MISLRHFGRLAEPVRAQERPEQPFSRSRFQRAWSIRRVGPKAPLRAPAELLAPRPLRLLEEGRDGGGKVFGSVLRDPMRSIDTHQARVWNLLRQSFTIGNRLPGIVNTP